ncbi:MAG: hypothetical protein RSF81_08315 [Oscillospiraceae bacterium]
MQRIKYTGKSFDVKTIYEENIGGINTITINFENANFEDIRNFYDIAIDKNILSNFEVFGVKNVVPDGATQPTEILELEGIHNGFTKPLDISCFGGEIKVKIQRELEVERIVRDQQEVVEQLLLASLTTL